MNQVDTDTTYRFVSKHDDVDYLRIIKEAPQGTPFILVEEKTRQNKPKSFSLFIHKTILNDQKFARTSKGGNPMSPKIYGQHLGSSWGDNRIGPVYLQNYRYISHAGKFNGIFKQKLVKLLNGHPAKDTLTEVTYI